MLLRNRRARLCVDGVEPRRQPLQRGVGQLRHHPQPVVIPHASFGRDIAKQNTQMLGAQSAAIPNSSGGVDDKRAMTLWLAFNHTAWLLNNPPEPSSIPG